jgi:hypothetical protein
MARSDLRDWDQERSRSPGDAQIPSTGLAGQARRPTIVDVSR